MCLFHGHVPHFPLCKFCELRGTQNSAEVFAREQKIAKRFLDVFFSVWEEQTQNGRFCSGENPFTSKAWKDPRFKKIKAHYARMHQCMVGLTHPGKGGRRHRKDTQFVSSSPNVSFFWMITAMDSMNMRQSKAHTKENRYQNCPKNTRQA